MNYLIVYVVLIVAVQHSKAIGITSHIEIAERTREFFERESDGVDYGRILRRHEDAFQAGAPYPDAYYPSLCVGGEFHYVSEDTHWTPFINATVNYIRDVYPKPWNITSEKLVAFLLSIVVHQVADVNWHSLDIDQGFLATMGKLNYHGSYSDAHSPGDFGGDVLNLFGIDMSYIGKITKWYVPTEDLLNIYDILYHGDSPMTEEVIENCTRWLFLGRLGENIGVVDKLYPFFAKRSPFLIDCLQDYYLGGMDDMAVWSMNIWEYTIDMLENGTDVCDLEYNPIYITCDAIHKMKHAYYHLRKHIDKHPAHIASKQENEEDAYEYVNEVNEALDMTEADITVEPFDRGIMLSTSDQMMKKLKQQKEQHIQHLYDMFHSMGNIEEDEVLYEPSTFYSTFESYSRLGESLLGGDVNNDGYEDLVIGAPGFSTENNKQQGRVYIIYGSQTGIPVYNMTTEDEADVILNGSYVHPNGRFGHAMTLVDINRDGYNDLAVSAPSEGSTQHSYNGTIYIYLGGDNFSPSMPDIEIHCMQIYCNLGWSLKSGDLNNDGYDDLVIGAPFAPMDGEQRGFVGVLYSGFSGGSVITENDFDWLYGGSQDYEWLGYSIEAALPPTVSSWLVVGAPTFRVCALSDCSYDVSDIQSVGKVYFFETPLSNESTHIITGENEFQQLGFALHSGVFGDEDYMFITSLTADLDTGVENTTQEGVVSLHPWSDIVSGNLNASTYLSGDRSYGRFGFNLKTLDIDGDSRNELFVTSALWSNSYFDGQESGRGYFFKAEDVADLFNTVQDSYISLGISTNRLRFGYGSAVITTEQESFLAVGIPHSSIDSRLGGGVAVYSLNGDSI